MQYLKLFISGFSPEELPTIVSEYLFKKSSNLRLFYIHTVVIFMNKDGKYVSILFGFFVLFVTVLQTVMSVRVLRFSAPF